MKQITFNLQYPLSANRYWQTRVMNAKSAGGRPMATTYISAEAKKYKAHVQTRVRAAGMNDIIKGRIKLEIWLYPNRPQDWQARQRKLGESWDDGVLCMDLDNANKVLLDAMKGLVFEDDKWVRQLIAQRMEPDEHGARVVVRITAMAPAQADQADLLEKSA